MRTEGRTLSLSLAPLGLAILAWGASLLVGFRYLEWVESALHSNITMLQVQGGSHYQTPANPVMRAAAVDGIRTALTHASDRAQRVGRWQLRMFLVGAVLYLVWHVLEMALRVAP